jgi:hypothetical protein
MHNWRLCRLPPLVAKNGTDWYRISVGTLKEEDIPDLLEKLEKALSKLQLVEKGN